MQKRKVVLLFLVVLLLCVFASALITTMKWETPANRTTVQPSIVETTMVWEQPTAINFSNLVPVSKEEYKRRMAIINEGGN